MSVEQEEAVRAIAAASRPADAASIVNLVNASPEVEVLLLGEATHGTHEFYDLRREVTLTLLRSGRFHAVVVEADFPDADRVSRFVRGSDPSIADALDALSGFSSRFPKWMWRNHETLELVRGMREINDAIPEATQRAVFAGLDVYALKRSSEAVVSYLLKIGDEEAARRARSRYACFDRFGDEGGDYARGVARGDPGCEQAAVSTLVDLLQVETKRAQAAAEASAAAAAAAAASAAEAASASAPPPPPLAPAAAAAARDDDALAALCNARSVVHAESYYRQMVLGRRNTWNLRDSAMAQTVLLIKSHLEGRALFGDGGGGGNGEEEEEEEEEKREEEEEGEKREEEEEEEEGKGEQGQNKTKRVIVWAHNSHLGDARATAMSRRGELNVGQLLREQLGKRVLGVGFLTNSGTVAAAASWGGAVLCRGIRPGMRGSYEHLLHGVSQLLREEEQQQSGAEASSSGAFLLDLRRSRASAAPSSSSSSSAALSAAAAAIEHLSTPRLERFIGVLYVPRTERYSHYSAACLPEQFDAVVFVDETTAVSPLDVGGGGGGRGGGGQGQGQQGPAMMTLEQWRSRVISPDDFSWAEE